MSFANNKFFRSYSHFISNPKRQKFLNTTLLLVVAIAIPLTVFISQQNILQQQAQAEELSTLQSPYACTCVGASITNGTDSITMVAGTPFTYTMQFKVNTTDLHITDFYGFYDNNLRINVPATCKTIQTNPSTNTGTFECSWKLHADAVPGTHNLSFYLRDYIDSATGLPAYEKTHCIPLRGISLTPKVTYYIVPTPDGTTPLITPPPSWNGPKVSYLITPQNPKQGEQFAVTIRNRSQALQYIALLVDSIPHWASSGGGSDDTTWNITSNNSQVKVQLVGNCDYNSGNAVGPTCPDPNGKYNEATINLQP